MPTKNFSIEEASQIIGRSAQTIRRWHRGNHLDFEPGRDKRGHRVFTENQIESLKLLRDDLLKKQCAKGGDS